MRIQTHLALVNKRKGSGHRAFKTPLASIKGRGFLRLRTLMPLCLHRWSTLRRWHNRLSNTYHVIQRCRKCDTWIRRDIDLKSNKAIIITERFVEKGEQVGLVRDSLKVEQVGVNGELPTQLVGDIANQFGLSGDVRSNQVMRDGDTLENKSLDSENPIRDNEPSDPNTSDGFQ